MVTKLIAIRTRSLFTLTACTRNGFVRTTSCVARSRSSFDIELLCVTCIRMPLSLHQICIGLPPSNMRVNPFSIKKNTLCPINRFFRSFGASGIRADLLLWNVYGKARDSTMSTF